MRDKDNTMVLFKDKLTIKFDRILKKGSSFIMFLKILPNKSERVNVTEETKEQSDEKVESNAILDISTKLKKANELL